MAIPTHYTTRYQWSGEAAAGTTSIEERDSLPVGSPLDNSVYSPEHLLLAASEVCLANTFLIIAEKSKITVSAYESTSEGELEFIPREGFRFKQIVAKPVITVAAGDEAKAEKVVDKAHNACLIARSLNCEVVVEPVIKTAS